MMPCSGFEDDLRYSPGQEHRVSLSTMEPDMCLFVFVFRENTVGEAEISTQYSVRYTDTQYASFKSRGVDLENP